MTVDSEHSMPMAIRAIPSWRRQLAGGAMVLLLAGCAVGPDYRQPALDMGEQYRAAQGWTQAGDAAIALQTDWWRLYDDALLDAMMLRLQRDNLTIQQAEARYRQAVAGLNVTQAGMLPGLSVNGGGTRSGSGTTAAGTQYSLSGTVTWEADVWGRIRRSVEAGDAGVQASAADVAAARLSMQSTLAQTYFRLRALDVERSLYARTLAAYERSLQMTENRFQAGVAALSDVATSRAQLENARVQDMALARQRAVYEHALAVLLGQAPSAFAVTRIDGLVPVPDVPVGMPSELLLRRPDVVAAERRVVQANAGIGVAQAAWFPSLTLSAQGGYRSGQWSQWLTAPAQFWSLGPALALALFDGGARQGRIDEARAAHDLQTATYRQTALTALREVEDYLVQLRGLADEQQVQARALDAARESLRLTGNQYQAGMIDYLSVVQVEASALSAERAAINLQKDRLLASVQLVAALGGGWQADTVGLAEPVAGGG